MPSVRLTVLPLPSVVTNEASREALMFWAILSRTKSQETLFQPAAPGARYWGEATRRGDTASCIAVAPLGHRRPSLTGLSGPPPILSRCTLPSAFCRGEAAREDPTRA